MGIISRATGYAMMTAAASRSENIANSDGEW